MQWGNNRDMLNSRCGEVAERTNAPASKSGIPYGYRGFESRPLRQKTKIIVLNYLVIETINKSYIPFYIPLLVW